MPPHPSSLAPATLRLTASRSPSTIRPFLSQRIAIRLQSTQHAPKPSDAASRLDRLLTRSQRWIPKRYHPTFAQLRSAPVSHTVAFLFLHEVTAVAMLFGLIAGFSYFDVVPTASVLGPWAAYAEEEARRFLRYAKRKGWFGLGEGESNREGEERLERDLHSEAEKVRAEEQRKGGGRLAFLRKRQSDQGADDGEASEKDRKGIVKAAKSLQEKMTAKNMETGYKLGIQICAAYIITKLFLVPRIGLSLWLTPATVRATMWMKRAILRR